MAQIILAGNNITELGWDETCRLAAEAARNGQPQLALALAKLNIHNAFRKEA